MRNTPARANWRDPPPAHSEFTARFPTDDACREYLKERFYPDGTICPGCGKRTRFHRVRTRTAYSCQFCGAQVYPTAGTLFHKSRVSLRLWFWAVFLMSSTRCAISVRQLERELGVTYNTAHRMHAAIRERLPQPEHTPPVHGEPSPGRPTTRLWQGRRRRS